MAHEQAAKRAEPRNGALDDPARAIDPQTTAILVGAMDPIRAVRTDKRDAPRGESRAERIAVVGAVADQAMRLAPAGRYARGERLIDERDLGRRGRGEAYSHRNTLTLHQYHALCTF